MDICIVVFTASYIKLIVELLWRNHPMRYALRGICILLAIVALAGAWITFSEALLYLPFFSIAHIVMLNPVNLFINAMVAFFLCLYMAFAWDYITPRDAQPHIVRYVKDYITQRCQNSKLWSSLYKIGRMLIWFIIIHICYYLFGFIVLSAVFGVLTL